MRKPDELTTIERRVLAFLHVFHADENQLPTLQVICARFGWKSNTSAFGCLCRLERKGHIERNAVGNYRFKRESTTEESK